MYWHCQIYLINTVTDMGALLYEEESYDFAVLSRSLWARNHNDVIAEVFRILKRGGHAIICESYQRWLASGGAGDPTAPATNTLVTALEAAGFTVTTRTPDDDPSVFQYIKVRKP
jgi:ubiquinone/menaquinone biosynthesis C-methylase UbiE